MYKDERDIWEIYLGRAKSAAEMGSGLLEECN